MNPIKKIRQRRKLRLEQKQKTSPQVKIVDVEDEEFLEDISDLLDLSVATEEERLVEEGEESLEDLADLSDLLKEVDIKPKKKKQKKT